MIRQSIFQLKQTKQINMLILPLKKILKLNYLKP